MSKPIPPLHRARRAERAAAGAFVLATLAALALAVVYVLGGHPQAEGALLALSLGGIGVGIVIWSRELMPHREETQEREDLRSSPEDRAGFEQALESGENVIARRSLLVRTLGAALGAFGLSALFPIWSLGPSPGRSLYVTSWTRGTRLVTREGEPIRLGDLEVGTVLTVFPEGHEHDSDAQTLLIRVAEGSLKPRKGRETWSPRGHIAYSKICTHAGCPVGLYQTESQNLLCPCHQSTFDVLDGARPVFGPATRSLPQLPLTIDDDGFLRAQSDYTEPVGPAFWNRG